MMHNHQKAYKVALLSLMLTIYFIISFGLFLATSYTINGAIIYIFLLLPFYVTLLLISWILVWGNRTKTAYINYRIWSIVLALQAATMLVAPGNCFGTKQGNRCYSNLQILFGGVPQSGSSSLPHWTLVEDAFLGLIAAYAVALLIAVISIQKSIRQE